MRNKMSDYNKTYGSHKAVFGDKPEKILVDFYKKIDNSSPVLDIGAGQGRHSLFLASEGFAVEAMEPSEVGIKQMKEIAEKNSYPIFLSQCDVSEFEPRVDYYSAVLIFNVLQLIKRDEIESLKKSLYDWVAEDSLIFITAFSTEEPSFASHKENDKEISKNSFEDANGMVRTYLEPNEILELFPDYKALYHREYLTEMHEHGDGKMHQHSMIEVVFEV